MNLFKKQAKDQKQEKNPDGFTLDEFIEKYKDIDKLAKLCWFLGVYPEELKKQLTTLMDKY